MYSKSLPSFSFSAVHSNSLALPDTVKGRTRDKDQTHTLAINEMAHKLTKETNNEAKAEETQSITGQRRRGTGPHLQSKNTAKDLDNEDLDKKLRVRRVRERCGGARDTDGDTTEEVAETNSEAPPEERETW